MLTTASNEAIVSTAKSLFLSGLAVVSYLSAEVTRRALQNHRYATGLSRPTGGEENDRCKVVQFLVTSTRISIFASFVQISGAVFLGVSLLAGWRMGIACSDGVFLVSCACTPACLANYQQVCTVAQCLCYMPAGTAFTRLWVYVPVTNYLARMRLRIFGYLKRRTGQDARYTMFWH